MVNDMRREPFQRLVWCWRVVWSWERDRTIHSKQDMVKSLTSITTKEIKRDKGTIKEGIAVAVSSLFSMNS